MHSYKYLFLVVVLSSAPVIFSGMEAQGEDVTLLGGDLTSTLPGRSAIQVVAPSVTNPVNREKQLAGFSIFHKSFTRKEGLGPKFVNNGCARCHIQNGKGPVRVGGSSQHSTVIVKVSLPGQDENGAPRDVPGVGEQLQDGTTSGRKRHRIKIRWKRVRGKYPDGTSYRLRKPRLKFKVRGYKQKEIVSSLRMTPLLVGSGLLEAIRESDILALSDPDDSDSDGISGRPNYVPNLRTGQLSLGRFGFRASHPTLEQMSAAAAFRDSGITNSLFQQPGESLELSAAELEILVAYQALSGVPIARNQDDAKIQKGKELFKSLSCAACHSMTMRTEHDLFDELDDQEIHPFTDLLLHDMGPGLADQRPEYSASGSEWRTTPLWGIGYSKILTKARLRYLHDGRARTLTEAILWHGGEAEAARENFKGLSRADRESLIAFLRSL